jgi:hypothetical protein
MGDYFFCNVCGCGFISSGWRLPSESVEDGDPIPFEPLCDCGMNSDEDDDEHEDDCEYGSLGYDGDAISREQMMVCLGFYI